MKAKFTNSFEQILQQSQSEALQRENQEWRTEHVLYALVTSGAGTGSGGSTQGSSGDDENSIVSILSLAGVSIPAFRASLETKLKSLPKVLSGNTQLYPSAELQKALAFAESEAKKMKDEYVAPEHFLLALFHSSLASTDAGKIIRDSGPTRHDFSDVFFRHFLT